MMQTKKWVSLALVLILAFCLLTACDKKNETDNNPNEQDTSSVVDGNVQGTGEAEAITQRWKEREFTQHEEDTVFLVPTTSDYLLTEAYNVTQPDTNIPYTLTILRSFDENGNVISQRTKYTFENSSDARLCYEVLTADNKDYLSLVCIGRVVYCDQPQSVIDEQRTKNQFAVDYAADGTKHWFSIIPTGVTIAAGDGPNFPDTPPVSQSLRIEIHSETSMTVWFAAPDAAEYYLVNQYSKVNMEECEYMWALDFGDPDTGHVFGIVTQWYCGGTDYDPLADQQNGENLRIPISEMSSFFCYQSEQNLIIPYYGEGLSARYENGYIVWELDAPADCGLNLYEVKNFRTTHHEGYPVDETPYIFNEHTYDEVVVK